MKRALLTVLLLMLAAPAAADQASKLTAIKRYLETIGMNATLLRMASPLTEQYMESFERVRPDAPEEVRTAMRQILEREFTQGVPELIDGVAALYDRAFTEDEVTAIVAFYDSPAGKKFVQLHPQVQRDSATLGLDWGRRMAEKAGQAFQETYKPKP